MTYLNKRRLMVIKKNITTIGKFCRKCLNFEFFSHFRSEEEGLDLFCLEVFFLFLNHLCICKNKPHTNTEIPKNLHWYMY